MKPQSFMWVAVAGVCGAGAVLSSIQENTQALCWALIAMQSAIGAIFESFNRK